MKQISSRDNPIYRSLLALVDSARARRDAGRTLLDGEHLIKAYGDAFGMDQVQVIARSSALDQPRVRSWLESGHDSIVLTDRLFDALAPVETPTGVLAAVPIPGHSPRQAGAGFAMLLDGIQDPGNLGSVLRSGAAAGASDAYLSKRCADPWSPKCLRGGMGAQFALHIEDRVDLVSVASAFEGQLIALDACASSSVFALDLSAGRFGFVLGSEGRGIDPKLTALAHARVAIPMQPNMESLNVSAAAAVCFYEWVRQRQGAIGHRT